MNSAMYVDAMLGAFFVLAIAGVLFAYGIRTLTIGRAVDARVARENGTLLLNLRGYFALTEPRRADAYAAEMTCMHATASMVSALTKSPRSTASVN